MIAVEVELLSGQGQVASSDSYRSRFPAHTTEIDSVFQRSDSPQDVPPDGQSPAALSDQVMHIEETKIEGPQSTLNPDQQAGLASDTNLNPSQKQFGDYELIEEIARGGMGVVFKAKQIKANRLVALKMILSGTLAGEAEVKRFYTEAEAAANLDHPGIVPVYDVGQIDGQHYFSMGFVEGRSLKDRIKRGGSLSSRDAAQLLLPIAQAMAYAHQMGVIHRDLKPANVLLDLDGQPKVTDFGLARQVESGSDLTQSGQIMGTPAYMAPEQAAGKTSEINASADVYALGAILYEMLTGAAPFAAKSSFEILRQVQDQPPKAPRQFSPSIDRDLETICLKCLEKEPAQRYASAQALVEELQRYLDGRPIQARPVGRLERAWRWCKRNPVVASLSTLLVLAAVTLASVLAFSNNDLENVADKDDVSRVSDDVSQVSDKVDQLEDTVQTVSQENLEAIRKLYEDPDVMIGKLKSHIRQKSEEKLAELRKDSAKNWRQINELEKQRDQQLKTVEELVTSIREGLSGDPDPIFAQAARILAEQGVDEALEFLQTKQPAIEQRVKAAKARREQAEVELRKSLEPWLMEADLHKRNLAWDKAREKYEQVVAEAPQWSRARRKLGSLLVGLAEYKAAELHLRAALDLAKDDRDRSSAANDLGGLYLYESKFSAAEPLLRSALASAEQRVERLNGQPSKDVIQSSGDYHDLSTSLNNLAGLLYMTSRLREAEELMRKALSVDKQQHGNEHPEVATGLNNLAALLQDTNRLAEAEPLMRRVVRIYEQFYGAKHPKVAIALNNLALFLKLTNRTVAAKALMRRALAIDEQCYGSNHPNIGIRLNNFAGILVVDNQTEEAAACMCGGLSILEKSYGAKHPEVTDVLSSLADLLKDLNRVGEAEALMRRALALNEEFYGSDHPKVARDLRRLAQLLQSTNRRLESEPLFLHALRIHELAFGAEHFEVASDINNLGLLLKDSNRPSEAEKCLYYALAINEQSFGPDHPKVAINLNNIALVLQSSSRLAECEPLLRRALAIDLESYGSEHANVAIRLNNFGGLLKLTNRLSHAETAYRYALTIDEQSLGTEHPDVARDLNNLAALMAARANLAMKDGDSKQFRQLLTKAETLMRRSLEILVLASRANQRQHPLVPKMLKNYVSVLRGQGCERPEIDEKLALVKRVSSPLRPIVPQANLLFGCTCPFLILENL